MLWFSDAKITLRPGDGEPDVRVEGTLQPHTARIRAFLRDLPLDHGVVKRRGGRWIFSKDFDDPTAQQMRNFLVNECPLKE
ncbi:MAG: hypothetical protein ACOCX4_09415 [Planctomycetota bacterium]